MKALKKIVVVLAILIGLLVIIGLFLPAKVHVERSMDIKAPVSVVFSQVNNLKSWDGWSPWQKMDPNMVNTYEGPASGVGAKHIWSSDNHNVGKGSMAITESIPDSFIKIHMSFNGRGEPDASFHFNKTTDATKVTWTMEMNNGWNIAGRYFGLAMDKMIGPDFEAGLKSLKEISENMAATPQIKVEETMSKDMHAVAMNAHCTTAEMGKKYGETRQLLSGYMSKNGLVQAGPDFAIYNNFSTENVDFDLGIPVNKPAKDAAAYHIKALELKAVPVLKVTYTGKYSGLSQVHTAIMDYAKAKNKQFVGAPWEVYLTSPMSEKDSSKYITEVYYPIK
jgi:effector-binding domain-containing protein